MDDSDDEFLEVCRTCLKKSEQLLPLTAIIDEDNFNVEDYLRKYVQFECIEDDTLLMPKNICLQCFDRLLEVRNYYIQCRESEKYLKLKCTIPQSPKTQHVEVKFEILDKNDIDSYEKLEILDDTDLLEIENNDEDITVISDTDNDENIENLDEKFLLSEDLDEQFEDFNVDILVESSEKVVEKTENVDGKCEYKNTIIKCICCNIIFHKSTDFENHECIPEKLKELDNLSSLDRMTSSCRHKCEFCECSFVLLGNLHRHMTISHKNIISDYSEKIDLDNLSLGCPNCGKKFIPKKKEDNFVSSYKKRKKQFVCTSCGKIYNNPQSFREHEFAHKGIKPYKCEYCGREFAHECVRRAHLKLHTGKDIVCPICNSTFAAQSQLRIHMTYHTNDLRFPCDMCPKRFRRNHVLQLHRKIHTGRKTEQCEHCDACFYTKNDLRGHMLSVHLKPYHCNLCSNRYSEPGRLRHHFLKIHNIEIQDVSSYKKKESELKILMRTRK